MSKKTLSLERIQKKYGRLFVLHWELGLLIFFIIPVLTSIVYSFSSVKVITDGVQIDLVGLKFYSYLIKEDANYINNLRDSLLSMAYSIPITFSLSLILAVILNQRFKGRIVARAIFFLPVITSASVVMTLLQSPNITVPLFSSLKPGQSTGMIDFNQILTSLRLPDGVTNIFSDFFGNVFELIWGCGIQIVLFIAGLQTIPPSLYEVSKVEGANAWEDFWFITIPMLGRVSLLVLVYTMIEFLVSVDNPVMKQAYAVLKKQQIYDRSAAMLWLYFAIIAIVMAAVFGLYWAFCLRKWE